MIKKYPFLKRKYFVAFISASILSVMACQSFSYANTKASSQTSLSGNILPFVKVELTQSQLSGSLDPKLANPVLSFSITGSVKTNIAGLSNGNPTSQGVTLSITTSNGALVSSQNSNYGLIVHYSGQVGGGWNSDISLNPMKPLFTNGIAPINITGALDSTSPRDRNNQVVSWQSVPAGTYTGTMTITATASGL